MKTMTNFFDLMLDETVATGALSRLQESIKPKTGGNIFYRYKNLDYNTTSTVRFLPISAELDESEVNPAFWLHKKIIRLRFDDPEIDDGVVILPIPVMQMYKGGKSEDDIILRQVVALYDEADKLKNAGEEEKAKQVRAKASYHWHRGERLAQGFVVRSGFVETDPPENPIRLLELNKQLSNVIDAALNSKDPEERLEYWPCHGKKGTNFVIKKTKSGDWPKYDAGSGFSRSGPTPWTDEQMAAMQEYGLFNLENFLPPRPTEDEYKVLAYIVSQSIAETRVWDPDWESHLENVKVYRSQNGDRAESSEVAEPAVRSQVQDVVAALNGPRVEPVSDEQASNSAEGAPVHVKTAGDVQAIVDKIKRTGGKTATAV